jgi:hypothetical protein
MHSWVFRSKLKFSAPRTLDSNSLKSDSLQAETLTGQYGPTVVHAWEMSPATAAGDSPAGGSRQPAETGSPKPASISSLEGLRFFQRRPWTDPYRKGPSLFQARPSSQIVAKLLLVPRFPRACRRPIAFTDTLTASAIPPLDETGSQVGTLAIAANQVVRFRLTILLFPERSCWRSFSRRGLQCRVFHHSTKSPKP